MCFKISSLILLSLGAFTHIIFITTYFITNDKVNYELSYKDYLRRFKKTIPENEFQERLAHFKKTLSAIERQNRNSNASFGLTKFADWSESEVANILLPSQGKCEEMHQDHCKDTRINRGRSIRVKILDKVDCYSFLTWDLQPNGSITVAFTKSIPKSYTFSFTEKTQWRENGAVGPVLDQKICPVCWAFSIIGVIESMAYIRYKHFTRLSIQEMIDCSFSKRSQKTGCRSGRPVVYALKYLCQKQMPITSEEKYPLTLAEETCNVEARNSGIRRVISFKNNCRLRYNETKILELLNKGPVTALVHAQYLFNYVGGIIDINCETTEGQLNHAVQLVGYDTTGGIPYYILKNSWGTDWGEGGYARLAARGNQCGVAFSIGSLEVE